MIRLQNDEKGETNVDLMDCAIMVFQLNAVDVEVLPHQLLDGKGQQV